MTHSLCKDLHCFSKGLRMFDAHALGRRGAASPQKGISAGRVEIAYGTAVPVSKQELVFSS